MAITGPTLTKTPSPDKVIILEHGQQGYYIAGQPHYRRNYKESDPCPDPDCNGSLYLYQDPCHCAAVKNPPCPSCTDAKMICNRCQEVPEDVDPY